jgi:hypothetical protein
MRTDRTAERRLWSRLAALGGRIDERRMALARESGLARRAHSRMARTLAPIGETGGSRCICSTAAAEHGL